MKANAALTVAELPREAIIRNPGQPRKDFDQAGIEELANSIDENGLLQPITVRPVADGQFEIVAGERRFRAISLLGWATVPCIVRDLEDAPAYVLSVMENVARRDMNVIEEAAALQQLLDTGMAPADIERKLGLPQQNGGYVNWKVSLLRCIDSVQHLLRRGQISQTMAGQLSKLSANGQLRALRELQANKLSQAEFTSLVGVIFAQENQVDMFPETKLDEETLTQAQAFRKALVTLANAAGRIDHVNADLLGEALAHDAAHVEALIEGAIATLTRARKGIQRRRGREVALAAVS